MEASLEGMKMQQLIYLSCSTRELEVCRKTMKIYIGTRESSKSGMPRYRRKHQPLEGPKLGGVEMPSGTWHYFKVQIVLCILNRDFSSWFACKLLPLASNLLEP
jgi:hypothetical protein